MNIFVAIFLSALFSCVPIASAKDQGIEASIERLASPNKPLNPKGDPFLIPTPPTYDEGAQEKIEQTVVELKKLGKAAFPHLIKHRLDRRYCRSSPTSIIRDFTVGETCMEILCSQIDSFDGRVESKGMPQYGYSVIMKDPVNWWKRHSNMTIAEMRIDALRWTIDAEKAEIAQLDDDYFKKHDTTRLEWEKQILNPLLGLLKAESENAKLLKAPQPHP